MKFGIIKNTATVEQVRSMLLQLKTPAMADCFVQLADDPQYQNLTLIECVSTMASQELESRALKREQRYLQRSGLRELNVWNQADAERGVFTAERNLKESELRRLLTCDWIRNARNVLINGATGTGKSWMLAVLGKEACMTGYRTLYCRYPQLLENLANARGHRETATLRKTLNAHKLLIIDDFGTASISEDLASDLLTLLEEREGNSSVAIASQLPFAEWHQYLGGNRNADAIMDRLLNTSYQFELAGRSLRERNNTASES